MILRPFNNVFTAETGQKALEILSENQIDLITLDLKLPGLQGVDLLREIKKQKPQVEVVIITGYGTLKSAIEGIRNGAADYLLKPFNVADLLAVVNKALDKKRRLDALRDFLGDLAQLEKPSERKVGDYLGFVRVLAKTLENRDPNTYGHCVRVNLYSQMIADRLGLSIKEKEDLELGAFLHDIGKVGISDRILLKDQKLSDQEYDVMKRHPEMGADLIVPLQVPPDVILIVRHHHERYDGQGYPDGLKGEDTPLLARIISLAESFDAMAATRPYRKAMTLEDSSMELRRCSGSQFDPVLVSVFLEIIAEKGKSIMPESIDIETKAVGA